MDRTAAAAAPRRFAWARWVIALLWIASVALTIAASSLHALDSAALYRFWSSLPGIVDVCGTPTLFARAIPPALALGGVGLTLLLDGSRRFLVSLRAGGLVLTIALAFAVMQNAELGQRLCVVD